MGSTGLDRPGREQLSSPALEPAPHLSPSIPDPDPGNLPLPCLFPTLSLCSLRLIVHVEIFKPGKGGLGQPGRQGRAALGSALALGVQCCIPGTSLPSTGQALAEFNRLELSPCPHPVPQFPLSEGDDILGVIIQ